MPKKLIEVALPLEATHERNANPSRSGKLPHSKGRGDLGGAPTTAFGPLLPNLRSSGTTRNRG